MNTTVKIVKKKMRLQNRNLQSRTVNKKKGDARMSIIYSCKNTLSLPIKCYMKKPYTRNIPLLIVGAKYAAFQLIFGLDIPFFLVVGFI